MLLFLLFKSYNLCHLQKRYDTPPESRYIQLNLASISPSVFELPLLPVRTSPKRREGEGILVPVAISVGEIKRVGEEEE